MSLTDEFDQRRYAQRLADVVHVDHQGGDTRQHEEVRRRHGDARNLPCAIAPVHDLADRQHGVHEGRDEEPDRELAGLVAKDPLHDPGRELPHRQLDDDHRDRQHERREAHHRDRDRGQDRVRRGRPTDEHLRDRLIVEGSVEGDRAEGDRRAREDTHDRHEPKARPHADRELSQPHEPSVTQLARVARIGSIDRRAAGGGSPFLLTLTQLRRCESVVALFIPEM